MPMIPEDIMVGLQSLAASDNMNDRQRTIMTEAAAIIKFQQHRVAEAERRQAAAEAQRQHTSALNEVLNIRMAGIASLNDYFRQQLIKLSELSLLPEDQETEQDQ